MNAWDGSLYSGPKEFHVNIPANHAPTVTASDISASRGDILNASSLFSANDADGDNLLYFFYDNSADPTSGHFTVDGVVQAAGTTFAVSAAQLAQTTFTAGTASSDDLFVNVWDGSLFSGPKEFHVNVPANRAPTVTASDISAAEGTYPQRVVAVLGQRCRRRQPAVLLLRQQRGPRERPLHGRRRGAGGGHDFRCVGGPAGADHLHGGDIEL